MTQTSVGEALSRTESLALLHVDSRMLLRCGEAGPLRLVRACLFRYMNSFCLVGRGRADLSCQSTSHPLKAKISWRTRCGDDTQRPPFGLRYITDDDPQNPTVRKEETQT